MLTRTHPDQFINHHDFRARARRILPRVLFDFIAGGAEDETTVAANRRAFEAVTFNVHKGVNAVPRIATRVLGHDIAMPVIVAPCGAARLIHPDGEVALARAATRAGTIYVEPHVAGHALEEVHEAATGPLWYQLYKIRGRETAEAAIARARAAGYGALVVTVDNPGAKRERDMRNGLVPLRTQPITRSWPYVPQVLARPGWLMRFLADKDAFATPNLVRPGAAEKHAGVPGSGVEPTFVWDDFNWINAAWGGPLIVKGILSADDARRALDAGARAVIVSNHGGRNVDGEPATLSVLPEVVAAVGDRAEVIFDSGIRRGGDVVKALAMGAKAVMVGRLSMFALAGGEESVFAALKLIERELSESLAAIGCGDVAGLDPSFVRVPAGWASDRPNGSPAISG